MSIHYIEDAELQKVVEAVKNKNRIETFNGADLAKEIRKEVLLKKIITNDASAPYSISAEELEGITWLRSYAFFGCEGLTSIVLPETLTLINNNIFYNCKDLYSVEFKGNVSTIGTNCFRNCENLQKIILRGNVVAKLRDETIIDSYCGAFDPTMAGIYVPSELIEEYKAATNWSAFFMLIKPLEMADEVLEVW